MRAESGGVASDLDVLAALQVLREQFTGAGPLDPLLRDARTTDVLVGAGGTVWVDRGALCPACWRGGPRISETRMASWVQVTGYQSNG